MRIKLRDVWKYLVGFPIATGIIWACTLLFPVEIKVANIWSLIIAGAMYYILTVTIVLMIFFLTALLINIRVAIVVGLLISLFAGAPVLLILDNFCGFWIGDPFIAILVSFISSSIIICCEFAILRQH